MKIIEFEVLVKLLNDNHIDYSSLGIAPPAEVTPLHRKDKRK